MTGCGTKAEQVCGCAFRQEGRLHFRLISEAVCDKMNLWREERRQKKRYFPI